MPRSSNFQCLPCLVRLVFWSTTRASPIRPSFARATMASAERALLSTTGYGSAGSAKAPAPELSGSEAAAAQGNRAR